MATIVPARKTEWGSDVIVEVLRRLGIEYVALNPGASFRGVHDSLVNYAGNTRPEMIVCPHEEIAVAIAHDLKLPIRYVGVGEAIDDLIPFSPDEYVDALFQEKW